MGMNRGFIAAANVDPNTKAMVAALADYVDGTATVGAKNGTTVSMADNAAPLLWHKTELTLTATPVTVTDDAGVAQFGGTGKIFDFPEGLLFVLGATVKGNLTLGVTGTIIAAYTGVCALGTATATTGASLTGTEADVMQSTAIGTASAAVSAVSAVSAAAALTESTGRTFNGTVTPVDLFLNFAIADDATHTSGTGTFTGTVTLVWAIISDV